MRPDGYYWIQYGKGRIQPAQWRNGRWWLIGEAEPMEDGYKFRVLGPCILPSDGPV